MITLKAVHGNGQVNNPEWLASVKKILAAVKGGEDFQHSKTKANTNNIKTNSITFATLYIYSIAFELLGHEDFQKTHHSPHVPYSSADTQTTKHIHVQQMNHSHDSSYLSLVLHSFLFCSFQVQSFCIGNFKVT